MITKEHKRNLPDVISVNYFPLVPFGHKKIRLLLEMKELRIIIHSHRILTAASKLRIIQSGIILHLS